MSPDRQDHRSTSAQELEDEERRARRVRAIVNLTSSVIMQGHISRAEARFWIAAARDKILELFPGRDETYEILYARRFERLIEEFTRPDRTRAKTLRFPPSDE